MRVLSAVAAAMLSCQVLTGAASAQAEEPAQVVCDAPEACPELQADQAQNVEVAGVQTSSDDARDAGESEPFIINDGFGD
jgi:hypothetical protein